MDDDLIGWLMSEINTNGKQLKSFTPANSSEFRCFLAILCLSGYLNVPRRRMLWERSSDTHCKLVSSAMQRDRFEFILSAANSIEDARIIRQFIDKLNLKFIRFSPRDDQHTFADTSIKNNCHKSAKKCIKLWCFCTKSGYCVNFIPENDSSAGSPQSLILNYLKTLLNHGICPLKLQFDCVCDETLFHNLVQLGVTGERIMRNKICQYLVGTDRVEVDINLYTPTITGKKSFLVSFNICMQLVMHNAWTLYKNQTQNGKISDILGFRRKVVIYYLQHYAKPILAQNKGKIDKTGCARGLSNEARFDGIRHYVIPQKKQTRCGFCRAKTTTRCQKCDVGVHVRCFVNYHTKSK